MIVKGWTVPNRKQSDLLSVDICKFILSIMVVAIHVSPVSQELRVYLLPLFRLAVPLFFMFSSYFLFLKLSTAGDGVEVLIKYITRNAQLYLFWYVVLFFPTVMYRSETYQAWFADGAVEGVFAICCQYCFLAPSGLHGFYPQVLLGQLDCIIWKKQIVRCPFS